MPSLSVLKTLCRELATSERSPRVNEPDLVMDDPDKVAAYTKAGLEDGVLAPVYLFHAAQVSEVVKPGDRVVDLGCGPATQMAMIARLNPEVRFTGVDLSPEMLTRARDHVSRESLLNVTLVEDDITQLQAFEDQSVDAVYSTVVLHHLPDVAALERTFAQVERILKPGGGLYLVDFGHLKSEKSIEAFAYQYADRQPELFTLDYLYSLRAAFDLCDYRWLTTKYFDGNAVVRSTFLMPFMVSVKSPPRADLGNARLKTAFRTMRENLPAWHQTDLTDLSTFFRLGGLKSRLLWG